MEKGPSPLVPSLLVLSLGLIIYWSSVMSILDMLLSLYQFASEVEKSFMACILVLLVLLFYVLMHFPSLFPFIDYYYGINRQASMSSSNDDDGFEFGFGTFLLVLLFILMYYLI
ncbi:hypothetical protein Ahy_A09g045917 [Arachis hypogaea]|uniref:Transmembrane protein n=1 Tax=Arachis hypogaea TaxID=3818 RepID=A0A445BNF3_ARAHY|nr:hypothetical protein Ahy_A09g045917 [Arachis hypogaea]